jgi:Ca2+-binding RTX toxin-like protein
MSVNARVILKNAELSLASYAVLASNSPTAQSSNIDALKQSGMSAKQAEEFAKQYPTVLTQYNDTAAEGGQGTSFSATVFKDDSGNLTLAMRGTAELFGTPNDLTTDSSISISGAGYDQIVAMYNWWMRESTPVGSTVLQYRIVPGPLDPHDGFQFGILWLQIMPPVAASGQLVAAIAADPDCKLDITGHSLGGHLGMAFGSLFATATSQVTVFNAPGFADTASNRSFFSVLGGTIPSGVATTNVIADEAKIGAVPWSAIAGLNSRPGTAVNVSVENQWLSDEPNTPAAFNHSQQTLTDALAVYSMLSQLDATLSTDAFKSILAGVTLGTAASLERIVDAVEKLFGINTVDLPTGNLNRDNLYQAIYGLQSNGAFKALAGNAKVESFSTKSADALTGLAKNGDLDAMAYRYALKAGNPFAVLGADYTQHNAAGELNLYDPATGTGELTDQWLKDRSAYVTWMTKANTADKLTLDGSTSGYTGDRNWEFTDLTKNQTITVKGRALGFESIAPANKVIFGSEGNDTYFSGDQADYLYGGAGMDRLDGGKGNDYIEGNAGSDILSGGEGADTLLGGTGLDNLEGGLGNDLLQGGADDDTLVGGKDNDRLEGGAGNDTYQFAAGDGWDTITDSDRVGKIEIGGITLDGGAENIAGSGFWQSADHKFQYALFTESDGSQTLNIFNLASPTDRLFIKNYRADKNLGIVLQNGPSAVDISTRLIIGDKDYGPDSSAHDDLGNPTGSSTPGSSDSLLGGASNDHVQGLAGDDRIKGLAGDDTLNGGECDARLYGEDGCANDETYIPRRVA